MKITVEPLSQHPRLVPVAAGWHFREWGHTDPGGSLETWTTALAGQARADRIPGTLIALADGSPTGVVCLIEHGMPGHELAAPLTPWIKGLYVVPELRRRCEAWAASLGYHDLYLYTRQRSEAEALYESLGRQATHRVHYEGVRVTVMRNGVSPRRSAPVRLRPRLKVVDLPWVGFMHGSRR